MKFPLAQRPFPPLLLLPEQCNALEATAMGVLREAVAEYDHHVHVQKRSMNRKHWKAVKSRENLTVFKKRDREDATMPMTEMRVHAPAAVSVSSQSSTGSADFTSTDVGSLPKLVGVGTIKGSLEDVMYGVVSPDDDSIKVKATYWDDELLDARVLFNVRYATLDDPFQFLGVKWVVNGSVNAVAKPRDCVFVEATGIHTQPDGSRVGYHVMHCVNLPELHELTSMGIRRGKFSTCFLFKQLTNTTVDVYMASCVEPTGNMPEIVAVMAAANGLLTCYKAASCAQNKKLAWFMRDGAAAARLRYHVRIDPATGTAEIRRNAQGKGCCALCEHAFSAFRTSITCELCRIVICSKCKTARKLTFVYGGKAVKKISSAFCKNCIATASQTSAVDVARFENVPGARSRRRPNTGSETSSDSSSTHRDGQLRRFSSQAETETSSLALSHCFGQDIMEGDEAARDLESFDSWDSKRRGEVRGRTVSAGEAKSYNGVESATLASGRQDELWLRMNTLRLQAEQAYQMTAQLSTQPRQDAQSQPQRSIQRY